MGIFTRFLGTTDEGRGEIGKYYAVLDTDAKDDVAIVWQDDTTGQIRYVCDCCVSKKYYHALPILKQCGRWGDDVKAKEGGTIEQFIQAEAEIAKVEAEIPQAEASVREHEQILAEGLPEVPVVEVVRLETLAVEGEEAQKLLFPEIVSPASARD